MTAAYYSSIEEPEKYEHVAGNKSIRLTRYELRIKKTSIHHERSRAVAELLWNIEPDIAIAEMARRSEIIQFGCEGHKYDTRTVCRWLASLKADRRPGRRKKVVSE